MYTRATNRSWEWYIEASNRKYDSGMAIRGETKVAIAPVRSPNQQSLGADRNTSMNELAVAADETYIKVLGRLACGKDFIT